MADARMERVHQIQGKSRAARISELACQIFLAIIVLQIPLFRVQCKSGTCRSPLELTAVQLASSKAAPPVVVKSILFPGACIRELVTNTSLPSWDKLLEIYNMTNLDAPVPSDILRFEVLAGSYFAVAGALIGVLKPGRMSMFGMLLIVWGLVKEGVFSNQSHGTVEASPTLFFAVVLSFLSIKYDFRKVQSITRPAAKPLKSSSKAKLK